MLYALIDAAFLAGLGGWMAVAVTDNWRHPDLNEEAVATVVRLDFLAKDFPEEYKQIAYRRIDDPRRIRFMFQSIRLAETAAAIGLLFSALLSILAAFGGIAPDTATTCALISAVFFTCIWAGFVIGGNYYCYWYCHQWAQSNHMMMMYWGFFVTLVLLN